jgi:hypothetical protein
LNPALNTGAETSHYSKSISIKLIDYLQYLISDIGIAIFSIINSPGGGGGCPNAPNKPDELGI